MACDVDVVVKRSSRRRSRKMRQVVGDDVIEELGGSWLSRRFGRDAKD